MANCQICLDPKNCDCLCDTCENSRRLYHEFQKFTIDELDRMGLGKNNTQLYDETMFQAWLRLNSEKE